MHWLSKSSNTDASLQQNFDENEMTRPCEEGDVTSSYNFEQKENGASCVEAEEAEVLRIRKAVENHIFDEAIDSTKNNIFVDQLAEVKEAYKQLQETSDSMRKFFRVRVTELEKRCQTLELNKQRSDTSICFLKDKCSFLEEQLKTIVKNLQVELRLQHNELQIRKEQFSKELHEVAGAPRDEAKLNDDVDAKDTQIENLKQIVAVREEQQERLAGQLHALNNSYIKLTETMRKQKLKEELLAADMSSLRTRWDKERSKCEELQGYFEQLKKEKGYRDMLTADSLMRPSFPNAVDITTQQHKRQPCDIPPIEFIANMRAEISVLFENYCNQHQPNEEEV